MTIKFGSEVDTTGITRQDRSMEKFCIQDLILTLHLCLICLLAFVIPVTITFVSDVVKFHLSNSLADMKLDRKPVPNKARARIVSPDVDSACTTVEHNRTYI